MLLHFMLRFSQYENTTTVLEVMLEILKGRTQEVKLTYYLQYGTDQKPSTGTPNSILEATFYVPVLGEEKGHRFKKIIIIEYSGHTFV